MTFVAPWFLVAGLGAIVGIVALHFLARQQPERWLLPTTRFVPASRERAPARSVALSDRLLLLLRVAAIALAALGFARPSFTVVKRATAQVIVADASRAVRDAADVARHVGMARKAGDRVVWIRAGAAGGAGSLSAALVSAIREAHELRDEANSVAIVVVSSLVREEFDAATAAVRATWPGGIEWRAVAAPDDSVRSVPVAVRAAVNDPILATIALAGMARRNDAPVRLVRDARLLDTDSMWAARPGHVLVHWSAAQGVARDTIGAVVTSRTVLVAAFPQPIAPTSGTPIAWWADGVVAATEQPLGAGCRRDVRVPVTPVGDLALRERTRDLLRDLTAPCGGARDFRVVDSATARMLRGSAPLTLATTILPARRESGRSAVPWLLALALLALAAEHLIRGRGDAA